MNVEKVRKRSAFKEKWDWFHAFIGFLSAICLLVHYGWISSLLIAVIFLIYESTQKEPPKKSYFDIVEFLVGFIIGLIWVMRR